MNSRFFKCALLILLGVVWGSGYSIARYCTTHGVPPLGYSFWQSLGPAIALNLLLLAKRQHLRFKPQALKYYFLCGLIGISIPNSVMYFGASHLPSALVAILANIVPLLIYPLSILTKQETISFKRLATILLGVIGIFLIVINQHDVPTLDSIPWTLIVLLTPICFASCAVFVNPLKPQNMNALNAAAGMLLASAILLIPFVGKEAAFYPLHWNLQSGLILLEIALSSLGYILFFKLLAVAGPVYYSLAAGVITLTGLFWGKILFQEMLSTIDWLGIACIFVSIFALTYFNAQRPAKTSESIVVPDFPG